VTIGEVMRRMGRRRFLASLPPLAAASAGLRCAGSTEPGPEPATPSSLVQTVTGPIDPGELGVTLVHEHVLVDFVGAEGASRDRYSADEAFDVILPHLAALAERGCRTMLECTPAYLGRDPVLLRRLSEASGVRLVTNTGYYGAAEDIAIPAHAWDEDADALAARWSAEAEQGLDGTGIRPGFLKIGVDAGPLSPIDRKLVVAAARAHRTTGLRAHIHTGDGEAAFEIQDVFDAERVPPDAYVWVHAQNEKDRERHLRAAERGVWVELDGVGPETLGSTADAVLDLAAAGHLERVLVSQDAGWYHVGEPRGGTFRPFTLLFDEFVPRRRERGFGEPEIRTLLVENPARLLTPWPRSG
jgi:predicted metal-dependent phosphotriesterase family hydrolase